MFRSVFLAVARRCRALPRAGRAGPTTRTGGLGPALQRQGPDRLEDPPDAEQGIRRDHREEGRRQGGRLRGDGEGQEGPALAGRGRDHHRRRAVHPPVQRARRLHRLPCSGSRPRSTTTATAGSTSGPPSGPASRTGYEAQINATHARPDPDRQPVPGLADTLKNYKDKIMVMNTAPHKPDEWFTQEVTADRRRRSRSRSTARRRSIGRTRRIPVQEGPLRPAGPRPRARS